MSLTRLLCDKCGFPLAFCACGKLGDGPANDSPLPPEVTPEQGKGRSGMAYPYPGRTEEERMGLPAATPSPAALAAAKEEKHYGVQELHEELARAKAHPLPATSQQKCRKCGTDIYQGVLCADCHSQKPMQYHKCKETGCETVLSEGSPSFCPDHQQSSAATPTPVGKIYDHKGNDITPLCAPAHGNEGTPEDRIGGWRITPEGLKMNGPTPPTKEETAEYLAHERADLLKANAALSEAFDKLREQVVTAEADNATLRKEVKINVENGLQLHVQLAKLTEERDEVAASLTEWMKTAQRRADSIAALQQQVSQLSAQLAAAREELANEKAAIQSTLKATSRELDSLRAARHPEAKA